VIQVQDMDVQAGQFRLQQVSFTVPAGQYGILMGRTGCGKTTTLEAICGLRPVCSGVIRLDGVDVTQHKPAQRGIGYVPQDGALFNTMTVATHLAFALRVRRWPKKAVDARVHELAELLDIGQLLTRRPFGLSGGERQRVALGRALSFRPRVLCMDEPLSALDDDTRYQMYALLKRAQRHEQVTVLHVTHNREDADNLADSILRMEGGRVVAQTAADSLTEPVIRHMSPRLGNAWPRDAREHV
jgi:molybdate/tungstate transport system ATP-binding protein